MRITYIANMADFDSPLGYCPNWKWIKEAFEAYNHTVETINENTSTVNEAVDAIKQHKAQLLLLEEGRLKGDHANDLKSHKTIIHGDIKHVMKSVGVPKVVWLTNIFMGVERREVEIDTNPIFKADIVFSTDGGHDLAWKKKGINHVTLRQGIHEPESYYGEPTFPTEAKIGFVGGIYEDIWPYRKELVEWLQNTYGKQFVHVGIRGEVRHEYLNNFCATVKIIVGDSVYSPGYWSNRIYEILGRGGFLIHPIIEGLDKEFEPGVHFVPYHYGDYVGLKRKIDYYLTHHEEREAIRKAGFEYCKKNYTYKKRVETLLDNLVQQKIITYDIAFPKRP